MWNQESQEMLISIVLHNTTKWPPSCFLLSCDWNSAFWLAEQPSRGVSTGSQRGCPHSTYIYMQHRLDRSGSALPVVWLKTETFSEMRLENFWCGHWSDAKNFLIREKLNWALKWPILGSQNMGSGRSLRPGSAPDKFLRVQLDLLSQQMFIINYFLRKYNSIQSRSRSMQISTGIFFPNSGWGQSVADPAAG